MQRRIDDPSLDVTPDSVLVLRNAGPLGGPGMPEWGMLPIPKKLLEQGVRDMVRISDARMCGTSYGTCVLHVAPESLRRRAAGAGPRRRPDRRSTSPAAASTWTSPKTSWPRAGPSGCRRRPRTRGYGALFADHVTQADEGCDFDFLARDGEVAAPESR